MTAADPLPAIPPEHQAWRVLHSHFLDAVEGRPQLGAKLLRLVGFTFARFLSAIVAQKTLRLRGIVTEGGELSYVLVRAVAEKVIVVCRVTAAEMGLDAETQQVEAERWNLVWHSENVPDDTSGLGS